MMPDGVKALGHQLYLMFLPLLFPPMSQGVQSALHGTLPLERQKDMTMKNNQPNHCLFSSSKGHPESPTVKEDTTSRRLLAWMTQNMLRSRYINTFGSFP